MGKYKILVKGIVEYEGKYLIVEKWYDDNISDPYQWQFIDGKLEFGESPENGVVRIVEQQTGIQGEIDRPLYTWSLMLGDACTIGITYLFIASTDEILLSEDLNNAKWIKKEEFDQYIFNQSVLEDLARIEF